MENNFYIKYANYVAFPIAVAIVGAIILYHFTIYVLPWLILIAIVIAAIWFYFWQRSTKRSAHPWD